MITDPIFYLLALPAVLIAGISKGGFGGGLGVVSVPLMALVVPPQQAAAIMLPILCLMDLIGVWAYRGKWDPPNMRILLPAAVVGIGIGSLAFGALDSNAIRLLIGMIAVGFTVNWWWRRRHPLRRADAPPSVVKGGFWGMVAGFTSFVAHAGGPPINIYLLPQNLHKTVYQATTVIFFIVVNYVKLVPYTLLGQFDAGTLKTAAVLVPLVPVGMLLGIWLHKRAADRLFYLVCYGFLFVTGLKLTWDGLTYLS